MLRKEIPSFKSYSNQEFDLDYRAGTVNDGRDNGYISASMVMQAIVLMGVMGLGSLLGLDQELRTELGISWFGEKSPLSDTTMARSLENMNIETLRTHLYSAYIIAKATGKSKVELKIGSRKIGIIDGSGFGNRLASCLEIIGPVSLMVDFEEIIKKGKELPASHRLLRRAAEKLGNGFVDILLGDGLYFNAPFFNLCLYDIETDVLVKTDETRRHVIQDAMLLFQSEECSEDIESVSGVDIDREVQYEIKKCSGLSMTGVAKEVTIAWVRETDVDGEVEQFWVVTTADYLTAEEMRELAHIRWDVEVNGFKELNQKMHTKHLYSHDENAWQAVLFILFITFNILEEFIHQFEDQIFGLYPGIKRTRLFIIRRVRESIRSYGQNFP
jgi:hypothetical protein